MFRKVMLVLMLTLLSSTLLLGVSYAADTTPPTGSIVINDGAAYASSTSVTLTLTYYDNDSGVDKVRYTNNHVWGSEPWEDPVATKSWNLTSGDGAKYVSYQIRDKAGNPPSSYWDSIVLETVAPTGSIIINDGAESTTSTTVTLTLTYEDAGSGVQAVRYTNKNTWSSEVWEDPVATKSWNLTSGSGMKYVSYQIRDSSGRISTSYWDTINLEIPTVAAPTFSPVGGNYSAIQNVTLSSSTAGAILRYTVDGSEPSSASTVYSGPIVVSSTVMIKAKAFKDGMTDSDTATATYTLNIVTPSPGAGFVMPPEALYAVIIVLVAAIAGVLMLLLRKSKSRSALGQFSTKPKLTKR